LWDLYQKSTGRGLSVSYDENVMQANCSRMHDPTLRPLLQIRRQRGEAPLNACKNHGGLQRLSGHGLTFAVKKTLIAATG